MDYFEMIGLPRDETPMRARMRTLIEAFGVDTKGS